MQAKDPVKSGSEEYVLFAKEHPERQGLNDGIFLRNNETVV